MEGDGVGTDAEGVFDGSGESLVVFVRADVRRAVYVDDVAFAVFVRVDARRGPLVREDGVSAAARDAVDSGFDIDEARDRAEGDAVVHRDDEVSPVCGNAVESCGESDVCVHV